MIYLRALLLLLVMVWDAFAQESPRVTVAPLQVVETDPVQVHGMAFTPNSRVVSHLRRPDGTEYEVIWFLTNERGEFSHTIDTLLLDPGTFELWVIDDATKRSSNVARFAVDFQANVPSPMEVQQVIDRYVGVWRAQSSGNETNSVTLAITGGNSGPVAGMIAFPTLECGAILAFRAVRADSVEFFQTSKYGAQRCGDGPIHVKLQADGAVALSGAATGVLTRLKD